MAEAKATASTATTPEKINVESEESDDEELLGKHSGVSTYYISTLESSQCHIYY